MGKEVKNKIVVLEPCTKVVEDLLKTISDRKQAELVRVSIPEEAVQLVRQFQPCMLVISLQENSEFPQRVSLLKNLESSIKYGLLKSLFVSKIKNKQIGTLITSLGITDFMEEPIPLRTLQFKANLQLKAVETIRKQQELKKASQEKIVFKKSGKTAAASASADPEAKATPALQIEEDSFLFKNSGVKKVGKKLVVELEGPDPASGEWVSHEDKGNAQSAWRWVPEEEKNTPEARRGDGWIHTGDKPHFQEANRKWQLASEQPELAYQRDGKKVAKKVSVNPAGEVCVAADSPKAEANIRKARAEAVRAKEQKLERKQDAAPSGAEAPIASAEAPSADTREKAETQERILTETRTEKESPLRARAEKSAVAEEESAAESPKQIEQEESAGRVVELREHRERKDAKKARASSLSPLEFLKKKKKERELEIGAQDLPEAKEQDAETVIAAPAQEKVSPARPEPEEEIQENSQQKKRHRSDKALSRLREKALSGLEPEEEAAADETLIGSASAEEGIESAEEPNLPAGEMLKSKRSPSPALIGEEKEKRRRPVRKDLVDLSPEERKKKVMQEVQEIISEPLPEELPPEEEERLRKKFDLEDSPEIGAAALARKERLEKVKALRESLLDFEDTEAKEAPDTRVHDLNEEESENTWSKKKFGKEKGVTRRAFDSDLSGDSREGGANGPDQLERESGQASRPAEDPFLYMPEIELSPVGNAWEKAGEHQVYLAGEIRYRGFARLQDLLPIWIYRGDTKPELLDRTKQWRFLDSLPFSATNVKEIPADVREFLLSLKSVLEEQNSEDEEALASLAEISGEESSIENAEENIGAGREAGAESGEPAPEKIARESNETSTEELAPVSTEAEARSEKEQIEADAPAATPPNQAATLEEIFEKKKPSFITESLNEKASSPAIEQFLERRKRKEKRAATAGADTQKHESANPYLGILVAMSNSFGPAIDGRRGLARVLKAIELSFGLCQCAILGPRDSDGLAEMKIGPAELPARLDPAGARPIQVENEILGYLLISPTEGRSGFSAQEEEMIAKVLAAIWPAVAREKERKVA